MKKFNGNSDESETESSEESEPEMEKMKKQLCAKDKEIKRLKQEIQNLRGKILLSNVKYFLQIPLQLWYTINQDT